MKLLTIKETCQILAIGKTTIYKLINQGSLQAIKIADCTRINQQDLYDFIDKLKKCSKKKK